MRIFTFKCMVYFFPDEVLRVRAGPRLLRLRLHRRRVPRGRRPRTVQGLPQLPHRVGNRLTVPIL